MVISDVARGTPLRSKTFMVCVVFRAYFYVAPIWQVYGDENKCGRLNVSMYGAIGAALNWHEHCKEHLLGIGFEQGKASFCIFDCPKRDMNVFIHRGDYMVVGGDLGLIRSSDEVKRHYESKVQTSVFDREDDKMVECAESHRYMAAMRKFGHGNLRG